MNNQNLPDIQNSKDEYDKRINWVGIRNYKIPFNVKTKDGGVTSTVGTVSLAVDLSTESRGVNMSRFSQVIEKALEKKLLDSDLVNDMVDACRIQLQQTDSRIRIDFPYFVKKKAPVSGEESHFYYDCHFEGVLEDGKKDLFLSVSVMYTSLCPCSKEMSSNGNGAGHGAHNQRSVGTIRIRFKDMKNFIWIEDLAEIIEKAGSCPIWNTLKRPDEKYVTERAYDNPGFVEDMVRKIAVVLDEMNDKIDYYQVTADHDESIHQCNAIATLERNFREENK